MTKKKCFNCNQIGDVKYACLLPPRARPIVRANSLGIVPTSSSHPTAQHKGNNVVLESLIYIFDMPFHVLFDMVASRSFISSSLFSSFHLEPNMVYDPLVMSNSIGRSTNLFMIFCGLRFSLNGYGFSIHAFILGFFDYDIIIGMDYMTEYYVIHDCNKRLVHVQGISGKELDLHCKCESEFMLSYLYSLDISHEELSAVPIVCEFCDAFGEVFGFQPYHEIELHIDLE